MGLGTGGDDGESDSGDNVFVEEYTTIGQVAPEIEGADEELIEESLLHDEDDDVVVDDNVEVDNDVDDDILTTTGFAPCALVAKELHMVRSDELTPFAKVEYIPSWRKAMLEEMASIEGNGT
jgi:hypothetical protein